MSATARGAQLQAWLERTLPGAHSLHPAAADASFRRHFRVRDAAGHSWIVVDAPPEHEDTAVYVNIAARLREGGLQVPELRAADHQQGFLLVSDLGQECYQKAHTDRLYEAAIAALVHIQCHVNTVGLPEYTARLLCAEMQLFEDWLLDRHLGIRPTTAERQMLHTVQHSLAEAALRQPRVFVHRDYHSRNLMVTPHHSPGILDFQDAVLGPYSYDLVSLLKDCYVDITPERRLARVRLYLELAHRAGLPQTQDVPAFLRCFELMGAQRHLKAVGIFARLQHRDGKSAYLAAIPRTLRYIAALRCTETQALSGFVSTRVLPVAEALCAP